MRRLVTLPDFLRTATGQKFLRYGLASVVNVIVAEAVLAFAYGIFQWPARRAAVLATLVAAFPAFWLARRWVWGRSGRSRLFKEVVPFWGLALLGMVLTIWVAGAAEHAAADITGTRTGQTIILMASVLAASVVFWAAKFILLNRLLFADPPGVAGADLAAHHPTLP